MARIETCQDRCRIGLGVFYLVAGILHVLLPKPFLSIVPGWVPDGAQVIWATGLCELAGAIGLQHPRFRRHAGLALALYAICVFPANIKHAVDSLTATNVSPWQWLYHTVRLPLQPVIVWIALFGGGNIQWPFRARSEPSLSKGYSINSSSPPAGQRSPPPAAIDEKVRSSSDRATGLVR